MVGKLVRVYIWKMLYKKLEEIREADNTTTSSNVHSRK